MRAAPTNDGCVRETNSWEWGGWIVVVTLPISSPMFVSAWSVLVTSTPPKFSFRWTNFVICLLAMTALCGEDDEEDLLLLLLLLVLLVLLVLMVLFV
jgi:hypothetical protein